MTTYSIKEIRKALKESKDVLKDLWKTCEDDHFTTYKMTKEDKKRQEIIHSTVEISSNFMIDNTVEMLKGRKEK